MCKLNNKNIFVLWFSIILLIGYSNYYSFSLLNSKKTICSWSNNAIDKVNDLKVSPYKENIALKNVKFKHIFLLNEANNVKKLSNQRNSKLDSKQKTSDYNYLLKLQTNLLDSQKISYLNCLCRIWGFLKYYHPNITLGKYNWDFELIRILPEIFACNSERDLNKVFINWIKTLGDIKPNKVHLIMDSTKVKVLPDLRDIIENKNFDVQLQQELLKIKNADRKGANSYVKLTSAGNPDFSGEQRYDDTTYPSSNYRLLSLFRYWNIIQYYYPYRYLIEDWKSILSEFIPKFYYAKNELEYKLNIQKLIGEIKDSHSNIWNYKIMGEYIGLKISALEVKWVENKFVVADYLNNKLGNYPAITKGCVIKAINGKKVDKIVEEWLPIFSASNRSRQLHLIANNLLRSNLDLNIIEYEKEGRILVDTVRFYSPMDSDFYTKYQKKDTCWKLIASEIGCLNVGAFNDKYINQIISEIKKTRGVIIDLRSYPTGNVIKLVSDLFLNKENNFAKFTKASITMPGLFTFLPMQKIGRENVEYYKGKVIIIVNENTISAGEFCAMALKTINGSIIVGSTTAGSDGNVSIVNLPGNILTKITGLGVYYPDGRETQRIGIIPDIYIEPTIKGIKEGRDEYLEKAIEVINKSQSGN